MNQKQQNEIPKMMTIRKAAATEIMPANAIKNLVKEGKIPSIKSGNRTLIDYNRLVSFLQEL